MSLPLLFYSQQTTKPRKWGFVVTTDACQALVKLLTVLFREAEEREEQDNGEMLLRVLHLQDTMLMKGISAMDDWFKEAERP